MAAPSAPRFDPFHELGPLDDLLPASAAVGRWFASSTTGPVEHGASVRTVVGAFGPERPGHVLRHPLEVGEEVAPDPDLPIAFDHDGFHHRAQVRFPAGTNVYGLGEHAGPLLRDGRSHLIWNTDAYGYDDRSRALYQAHPWALLVHADGRATGVLFDTFRRGSIGCFSDGLEGVFEDESFDVHVVRAEDPDDVLRALGAMVGTAPRIPPWALGYHQCRYSYMDEGEVRDVARQLREQRIPCDALWFDIDYMDRYRVFSWDHERFPDPRGLTDDLRQQGLHAVAILDPGVVDDESDPVRAEAVAGEHLVLGPDDAPAGGRVWPGACHFPDFTRAETRAWWAGRVRRFVDDSGLDGLWCDMNEPALLGAPTRTLREDARHRGSPGGTHARVHNLYGHLMVEATHAGASAAAGDRRPFVLTRAAHLATAARAATWTGDNQSHPADLAWSIPMVLNLGLSGQALAGPDVGGFTGAVDEELFVRWFEAAALLPFCRGHSEKGTPRKEPWVFGDDATTRVRAALELRMSLLPLLLTLADTAHREGLPICRPVWMADPCDAELRAIDDAFLLGGDLLVAPHVETGAASRCVRLPRGEWSPLAEPATVHAGPCALELEASPGTPVLVRRGALVPRCAPAQHTGALAPDWTLDAFLDEGGRARGVVVHDDGRVIERHVFDVELDGDTLRVARDGEGTARPWTVVAHSRDGRRVSGPAFSGPAGSA